MSAEAALRRKLEARVGQLLALRQRLDGELRQSALDLARSELDRAAALHQLATQASELAAAEALLRFCARRSAARASPPARWR